jgi:predicted PurR-regulated permease PerM
MSESEAIPSAETPGAGARPSRRLIEFSPRNIWRVGLVVLGVVAFGLFVRFVIDDGGGVLFTVLMAWFGAIAMAPAVDRLARHMRRGLATAIVMGGLAAAVVLFFLVFGRMFADQLAELIREIPDLLDDLLAWVNSTFSQSLSRDDILSSVNLSPAEITSLATTVGVNLLGVVLSVVVGVFSLFTFGLFLFYLSSDMPRFVRWSARLFPARLQQVAATVWTLTEEKTGGYVMARVVLAAINSATTAVVFVIIGMPSWLPLALWTGVVAQFVPTIGTYISIALPVIVGLLSPNPWIGVIALVWAIVYQQVENLTIEPKINAKAVDMHPAVAFGSVLLGAALFGVAGAFLAVPVTAMLLSLLDIYGHRHELLPAVERSVEQIEYRPRPPRADPPDGEVPTAPPKTPDGRGL